VRATVYDFAHIGTSHICFPGRLAAVFEMRGYRVTQVMNLTDVDDRINPKAAARA